MDRINRIYLVRHGQVVGHDGFRANGHTDVDITEVGREQMEFLAGRLRLTPIKALYSSDLKRTKIGARIIARHHDIAHRILSELRELYFGKWEGLPLSRIREEYPGELDKRQDDIVNYRPPGGGESMHDLSERVLTCYREILKEQEGSDILIVAHGGVNRVILCAALGLDLSNVFRIQQDYGCLNIIDYFPDHTVVQLING
jgi:alpha-ribazole phosphatase